MNEKRNLNFEEFIIKLSRLKKTLPTTSFRRMVDRLSKLGRIDEDSIKIIKETEDETFTKKGT